MPDWYVDGSILLSWKYEVNDSFGSSMFMFDDRRWIVDDILVLTDHNIFIPISAIWFTLTSCVQGNTTS